MNQKVHMAGEMETEEEKQSEKVFEVREMENYEEKAFLTSVMFSERNPAEIMDMIISKLRDKDVNPKLHSKKWKLTFERICELDENEKTNGVDPEYCNVQVKLLKVPDNLE